MGISKSRVERWLLLSWRILSVCCLWCPIAALVFVISHVLAPSNSFASKATIGLVGAAVGFLFVVAGGYCALVGVSLFYRRIRTTQTGALCGLLAGLLLGAFIACVGVIGFLMTLR
jgi:hypothetical protein